MAQMPCRNENCNSYGQPHPNCRCYGGFADGGQVGRFCDMGEPHKAGCGYAKGGVVKEPTLQEETETHYTINHPSGDVLKIAKRGLSDGMHAFIQKMARGGQVQEETQLPTTEDSLRRDLSKPTTPQAPHPDPDDQNRKWSSQGIRGRYAEGGEVQQPPVTININSGTPQQQPMAHFAEGGEAAAAPAESGGSTGHTPGPMTPLPGADTSGIPNYMGQTQQATANIQSGLQQQAEAEKAMAAQQATLYQQQAQQMQQEQAAIKAVSDDIVGKQMAIADGIANGEIDFNRVWKNAGTPKRILAAIGMALGSFGSGITKTPNYALKIIDDEIARDIDSQKQEMENKKSAMGAYSSVLQNRTQTAQLTHTLGQAAVIAQINKITAGQGGPLAEAKKRLLLGQMLPKLQESTYNLAVQRANWDYLMKQEPQQSARAPQQGQEQGPAQIPAGPDLGKTGAVDLKKMNAYQMAGIKEFNADKATTEAKEFEEAQMTKKNLVEDLAQMSDAIEKNKKFVNEHKTFIPGITTKTDPLSKEKIVEAIGHLPFEFGKAAQHLLEPWSGEVGQQYRVAQASALNKVNSILTKRIGGEALKNVKVQLPDMYDSPEEIKKKTERIMNLIDANTSTPTLDRWGLIKK